MAGTWQQACGQPRLAWPSHLPLLPLCHDPLGSLLGGGSQAPGAPGVAAAALCPRSRSPWERAPEDGWRGERSSCPLLYLLHLANLMTGGMRSISNMASLAGSGQSTQEAFLHTPIPTGCCRSLLPRASRCHLPRAGGDRHGWSSPSCPAAGWMWPFAGRLCRQPWAGVGSRGDLRASPGAWARAECVPMTGSGMSPLPAALAGAQASCSAPNPLDRPGGAAQCTRDGSQGVPWEQGLSERPQGGGHGVVARPAWGGDLGGKVQRGFECRGGAPWGAGGVGAPHRDCSWFPELPGWSPQCIHVGSCASA